MSEKLKVVFCVELNEEQEHIYKQLLSSNPDWLIQGKIVLLGFETLKDLKTRNMI